MKDTTNPGRTDEKDQTEGQAASEPGEENAPQSDSPEGLTDPPGAEPEAAEPVSPYAIPDESTGPDIVPDGSAPSPPADPYQNLSTEPALPPSPPSPPTPPAAAGETPEEEPEEEEERELGARMTFLEHLDELRKRILYSILAMAVGFSASWVFREEIFAFIKKPIDQVVKELVMTKPTEAFTIYMKVAFVGGIFIAIPVILLQIWLFIAPGLYRKERRFVLPFLFSSTVLFLTGGAFAYYIVLPPALRFLIVEFGSQFTPMIKAEDYFDLVFVIIVGMGAVFQLPVLIAFLSMFGLISPGFLWRNFRYAFLLIVIAAAVVSPTTDPFNLLLWTGPMVVLYLIGIVVSWIFKRRREKREKAELG